MSTEIIVTKDGAVATLTFRSPNGLHILSREALESLERELDALGHDQTLRALVLTGEGERAFSAGADLRELEQLNHETAFAYSEYGQSVMQHVARYPVPTIAAINGPAFGGGIELALACDFRLAAPGARFHYQAAKLGLLPGWGGTQRLADLVGRSRAKHMMIMCRPVTAAEALDWGLVDAIAEGALSPLVSEWTTGLAALSPVAAVQIKRAIDLSFSADFRGEREAFAACFADGQTQARLRDWLGAPQ